MNNAAFLDYQNYAIDQQNKIALFNSEVFQWAYALALPVIGLLVLCFFLSLGGAFALLGPWVIFIAARIITRYYDKKTQTIENFEIKRQTY